MFKREDSMRMFLALAAVSLSLTACASMTVANDDPNIWLEDVHGEKALAWVKGENERTLKRLTGDKRYETYRREALKIFTAKDRIPLPGFRAGGVDNLWQDAKHPHGVWRSATLASYRAGKPRGRRFSISMRCRARRDATGSSRAPTASRQRNGCALSVCRTVVGTPSRFASLMRRRVPS
jgi:hypothetical protein